MACLPSGVRLGDGNREIEEWIVYQFVLEPLYLWRLELVSEVYLHAILLLCEQTNMDLYCLFEFLAQNSLRTVSPSIEFEFECCTSD